MTSTCPARSGVPFIDILIEGHDIQARIEFEQAPLDGLDPRLADPVMCHQQLPVQIRGLDVPRMGEDEATDAGRGQFQRHHAAQASDA